MERKKLFLVYNSIAERTEGRNSRQEPTEAMKEHALLACSSLSLSLLSISSRTTCTGLVRPQWAGTFHINHQSRRRPTDLYLRHSYSDFLSIKVFSSQDDLCLFGLTRNLNQDKVIDTNSGCSFSTNLTTLIKFLPK